MFLTLSRPRAAALLTLLLSLATACTPEEEKSAAEQEYIQIPEGAFMMGCNESVDSHCEPDEYPYHEVWLDSYEISRTEVSVTQYQDCVLSDDSARSCPQPVGGELFESDPADPVTGVTKDQAARFCDWADGRLPTEAEWERAARGPDQALYPWGNEDPSCDLANWRACGRGLDPVDSNAAGASPFGLLNVAGNVWEWVSDGYDGNYYETSPSENPEASSSAGLGTVRSVDLYATPTALRTSNRQISLIETFSPIVGFRCARDSE